VGVEGSRHDVVHGNSNNFSGMIETKTRIKFSIGYSETRLARTVRV